MTMYRSNFRRKDHSPTESQEQQLIFEWAEYQRGKYPELGLMYHIANEGQRSAATGARLKAEGLKPGTPDICLPVARGSFHALYIELKKRSVSAVPTDAQVERMKALALAGNAVCWCWGADAAIEIIKRYLDKGVLLYTPIGGRGGELHA